MGHWLPKPLEVCRERQLKGPHWKSAKEVGRMLAMSRNCSRWPICQISEFREEFSHAPLRSIPSSTNNLFSCKSTYRKAAFAKFSSVTDKSSNVDNVRKAWASYKEKMNFLPEENFARLNQMHTGH